MLVKTFTIEVGRLMKRIKVNFKSVGKVVEVDAAKFPLGDHGLSGSILDIAMANGVDIDHACGGVLACSTCHIYVKEGFKNCNEASDEELDQLEEAPGLKLDSRLACQCVPNGTAEVVVEIPGWNRNFAREGQ
jgi:2Fe-2S ferredoxin